MGGRVPGKWSVSRSASWGRPEFEPGFFTVSWALLPSPRWSLGFTGSIVHQRPSTWLARRMNPPPDQAVYWHLVGSSPGGWGIHPSDKGGDKSLSPQF
jgi:hypothetical protein